MKCCNHVADKSHNKYPEYHGRKRSYYAVILSVLTTFVISAMKLFVAYYSDSVGMSAELIHIAADVSIVILAYFIHCFCNFWRNYRKKTAVLLFNIKKLEYLLMMINVGLLFIGSVFIIHEVYERFYQFWYGQMSYSVTLSLVIVTVLSFVFNIGMYYVLLYLSPKDDVISAGNAIHFFVDGIGSCVVLVGFILAYFQYFIFDIVAGLFIAIFLFKESYNLGKRIVMFLIDACPEKVINDIVLTGKLINLEFSNIDLSYSENGYRIILSLPRHYTMEVLSNFADEIYKKYNAALAINFEQSILYFSHDCSDNKEKLIGKQSTKTTVNCSIDSHLSDDDSCLQEDKK